MKTSWKSILLAFAALVGIAGSVGAYRVYRGVTLGAAMAGNIRFQLESGETLDTIPANEALSRNYLQVIFGENPALMAELQRVLQKGLQDSSRLQFDEVSALLITYRSGATPDSVTNVCAHIFGSYRVAQRRPGFHRDGYFKHLVDRGLWDLGNTMIGFLGRDVLLFADENTEAMQNHIFDSMFTGEIKHVVTAVEQPYHYILAIPNPRKLLPPQLRRHIQTVILKGTMELYKGGTELILLCGTDKAADYTSSVFGDLKTGTEVTLKTRFGGYVSEREWGPHVECWWAYELAMTLARSKFKPKDNIVRFNMKYGRVMNNVLLKGIERMGRDLFQQTASLGKKMDPRAVDALMQSKRGSHYWSAEHRWGPNWPIEPPKESDLDKTNNGVVPVELPPPVAPAPGPVVPAP